MLIELNVQIVQYISLGQCVKPKNPSNSHDILDKADHYSQNMCYPITNVLNHIFDYKTNQFD